MIDVAHLLDDFGMGGVTRAITVFDQPELAGHATSQIVPIDPGALLAPSLNADLIVDHMALSWKRLAFLASLRARNPRARIVHVEHSYTRAFEANHVEKAGRFRAMLKLAMHCFDQFICVSQAQREWLLNDVGLPSHKLRMIHPWSGRFELNAVPSAELRYDRPLRLLAYGRLAEAKNFKELLIAMRSFTNKQVELSIVGDGPEHATLAKLAKSLDHVSMHPATNDVASHLAHCDAVIVPSRREAFGLVATEARLAGRAIIVSDVDGLTEQVGTAGIAAPMQSAYDIATMIRWAFRAPLAGMGAAGRAEVAAQHDQIIAGWLDLFDWAQREARYHAVSFKDAMAQ